MVNITLWKTVITITLIQKTEQKNSMRKAKFCKLCNKSIGFIYFGILLLSIHWGMGHLLRIDTIMIIIKITRN